MVNQETFDIDDRASLDDDGVSRGSKSNYSEVDENDRASSSRIVFQKNRIKMDFDSSNAS